MKIDVNLLVEAIDKRYVSNLLETQLKSRKQSSDRLSFYSIGHDEGTFETIFLRDYSQKISGDYFLGYCEARQGHKIEFSNCKFSSQISQYKLKNFHEEFQTIDELKEILRGNLYELLKRKHS